MRAKLSLMDPQPIVIDESDVFNKKDLEDEGIFIEHEPQINEASSGDITTTSVKKELFDTGGVEILKDGKFIDMEDEIDLI